MSYMHLDPPFLTECNAVPICRDPLCEIAAKRGTKKLMKECSKDMDEAGIRESLYSIKARQCEACGALDSPGSALRKCTRCTVVYYCSKDCQKRHWKEHRPRCLPA